MFNHISVYIYKALKAPETGEKKKKNKARYLGGLCACRRGGSSIPGPVAAVVYLFVPGY